MFCPKFQEFAKCSREMNGSFKDRFKKALARRLYPHTALRPDALAGEVGVHGMTLRNWLRGECGASGEMIDACISYFTWRGDHAFICELYPHAVTPLVQRAKQNEKKAAVVDALQELWKEGAAA